jgi:hypothetical protein
MSDNQANALRAGLRNFAAYSGRSGPLKQSLAVGITHFLSFFDGAPDWDALHQIAASETPVPASRATEVSLEVVHTIRIAARVIGCWLEVVMPRADYEPSGRTAHGQMLMGAL